MGATEVLHGVSASTVALILGLYQELISSLKQLDREAFKISRKDFNRFWQRVNGAFLSVLILGMLLGFVVLSKLFSFIHAQFFIVSSSFLFGLILVSGVLLLRKIKRWSPGLVVPWISGFFVSFFLMTIPPVNIADNFLTVALTGLLSGFAFLIPGISSSLVAVWLGQYEFMVSSLLEPNVLALILFALAFLLGLGIGARIIYQLLSNYYSTTVALLAGLMLGSLNKLWPWRQITEYVANSAGERIPAFDVSVLPWKYMALTGKDPQVLQAILMMALGVFIVVLIEKIAAGLKTKI